MRKKYIKFFEEKEYLVGISPTSMGTFVAYDPIRIERLYKKGTITPLHFKSEQEAQEYALKYLTKKYPNHKFVF
jgi:hypothetical protein